MLSSAAVAFGQYIIVHWTRICRTAGENGDFFNRKPRLRLPHVTSLIQGASILLLDQIIAYLALARCLFAASATCFTMSVVSKVEVGPAFRICVVVQVVVLARGDKRTSSVPVVALTRLKQMFSMPLPIGFQSLEFRSRHRVPARPREEDLVEYLACCAMLGCKLSPTSSYTSVGRSSQTDIVAEFKTRIEVVEKGSRKGTKIEQSRSLSIYARRLPVQWVVEYARGNYSILVMNAACLSIKKIRLRMLPMHQLWSLNVPGWGGAVALMPPHASV